MNKISAVIITFNEERNILDCIKSLEDYVDEILVVDSYSTDQTKDICQGENVTYLENSFEGHIQQKNFAMSQAKNDWVLSLDADERLSAELQHSLKQLKIDDSCAAFEMNRLNNYCGQWIKHGAWYPDRKIRLWNRNLGKWGGANPHDHVNLTEGKKATWLKGDIIHYSYRNIEEHKKQIEYFSTIAAKAAFQNGRRSHWAKIYLRPIGKFFRDYIVKLGFLDGRNGFIIAKLSAGEKKKKFQKLLLLQKEARGSE